MTSSSGDPGGGYGGKRHRTSRRPGQLRGGRHGLTPEEVASSQRERILAAMAEVVGRLGYQAAPVADVIRQAGVSRKTFYEHFEDKERCFAAIYRHSVEHVLEPAFEVFDSQDEWADRLRAGLAALLGTLSREPALARVCFVEGVTAGDAILAERAEGMDRLAQLYYCDRSDIDEDLRRFMATVATGGLCEILLREILAGRTADLPRLLPRLMYAGTLPVLGAEAAERELRA